MIPKRRKRGWWTHALEDRLCAGCGRKAYFLMVGLCGQCFHRRKREEAGLDACEAERHAAEPTHALPGTRKKIEVMAERRQRGEALFHAEDATVGINET